MTPCFTTLAILCVVAGAQADQPWIALANSARPGTLMPALGLGTGGYGSYYHNMSEVAEAVSAWLKMGGRRIDTSFSYNDQPGVAAGMALSGLAREQIFITSKVGPYEPLGYNDTLTQFQQVLQTLNTSYVDLLLVHWPGPASNSSDPACAGPSSSPQACRQSTWRAMELIYQQGGARAIGVSNFEQNHLEDIFALKSLMPSINQVEFHPYWHEDDLVAYCAEYNITFNGYSPLGARDVSPARCGWDLTQDKTLIALAAQYKRTPAQIALNWEWQQGVLLNPRTKNVTHMQENLAIFDFYLGPAEMQQIRALQAPTNHPKVCEDPHQIP